MTTLASSRTYRVAAWAVLAPLLLPLPALAQVEVTFREGAPKDRFTIINTSGCGLGAMDVTVDLSGSAAGLIFDVTAQGAGVQVFQPFDVVAGEELLLSTPQVRDGDTDVTLALSALPAGQAVAFTIDVDDTIGAREITVSRSEISGAGVRIATPSAELSGVFGTDSRARVPLQGCVS